jgi:hypothetical protein
MGPRGIINRIAPLAATLIAVALASPSAADASPVPLVPGDVLIGDGGASVEHFDANGHRLATLQTFSGATIETGMCFDAEHNLYTTNWDANTISVFDGGGNLVNSSFTNWVFDAQPESCVFNRADEIFVGQADGSHAVWKLDHDGALTRIFFPAVENRGSDWIDLANDQCTLVYTSSGTHIKRFDVCANRQLSDFASGLPGPCHAHRITSDGGDIVACQTMALRLDAGGNVTKTYRPTGATLLSTLDLDPAGTSFWVADALSGQVWRFAIGSGQLLATFNAHPTRSIGGLAVVGAAASGPSLHPTSTSVSCSPAQLVAGQSTICTATVSDTAVSGRTTPTGSVVFADDAGRFDHNACTLSGGGASASCSVTYLPASGTPDRSESISATYGGDRTHALSRGATTIRVLSFERLAAGTFVVGDQASKPGGRVTFWSPRWSTLNAIGGAGMASFKGFAADVSHNPPRCGDRWTARPGAGTSPPPVPRYMAAVVTSAPNKSGSTISGTASKVVVIKTDAPQGTAFTGTVVAQLCP